MQIFQESVPIPLVIILRAHLLTTCKASGGMPAASCALRGGCGFCGSLMDNATSLDRCCHCPRSRQNCFAICKTRLSQNALSSANCLRKPATGSFIADMDGSTPSIFFLRKRNKTQERKDGENEWRSTTWKQRLSAEETDAPLLRHPLI